jgi:hypothetical protein
MKRKVNIFLDVLLVVTFVSAWLGELFKDSDWLDISNSDSLFKYAIPVLFNLVIIKLLLSQEFDWSDKSIEKNKGPFLFFLLLLGLSIVINALFIVTW